MKVTELKRILSVLEDEAKVYVKNMGSSKVEPTTGLQVVWVERSNLKPLVEIVIQY